MRSRVVQLVWEQARQSVWMIFALATGVLPCGVAECILRLEAAYPRLNAVFFLKEQEAVHLCDIWIVISSIAVIFGTCMSQERKSEFSIALPTRLLRMPVPTPLLAITWLGTRLVLALGTLGAMLAVRQVAIDGQTQLPFVEALAFFGGGCFVMLGAIRLAEVWSDRAAWAAVFLVFMLGAVYKDLWRYAQMSPLNVFDASVVGGLCCGLIGIALRRRGGVVTGWDRFAVRQGAQYARVADIPQFSTPEDAQTWWEWRFSGRVFPALVFIGCVIATGPIFVGRWLRMLGVIIDPLQRVDFGVRDVFFLLVAVPLWSAALASIQLAARSAFRRDRPQGRFLRVRPMGGWTYSVARHRMLRRSAALGLALVPVFLIGTLVYAIVFSQPYEQGPREPSYAASEVIRTVENLLFPVKYSAPSYTLTRGDLTEALVMCCGYGLAFVALFTAANGVLPLVIFLLIMVITLVGQLTYTFYDLDFVFNVLPMLLAWSSIAHAVFIGVISLRRGLVFATLGFCLTMATGMLGGDTLLSVAPMVLICAIIAGAMPSVALTYHAARVADFRPTRLAHARLDWNDAKGFLQLTAALAIVALGTLFTWRWTVQESLQLELARVKELGLPPYLARRGQTEPVLPRDAPKLAGTGDVPAHLHAFFLTGSNLHMDILPNQRAIVISGPTPALSTAAEGISLDDEAGFPTEGRQLFAKMQSQLSALRAAGAALKVEELEQNDNLGAMRESLRTWLVLSMYDAAEIHGAELDIDLHVAFALFRQLWEKERTPYWHSRFSDNEPANLCVALEFILQHTELTADLLDSLRERLPQVRQVDQFRKYFRPVSFVDYSEAYQYTYSSRYPLNFYGNIPLSKYLGPRLFLTPTASYAAYLHEMAESFQTHTRCFGDRRDGRNGIWFTPRRPYDAHTEIPFATEESGAPSDTHQFLHRSDGTMSLLRQAVILEQYRARYGEYPEQLTGCVPGIVPDLPVDWTRVGVQQPCGYLRLSPTSCKVWAAGDGYDNRGLRHSYEGERGADIVIRLNRAQ